MAGPPELRRFMRAIPLFAGLLPSELDRVALVMNPMQVSAGDVVCTEGEPGHEFYLLAEGEAAVERSGHTVAKL
jgi:CRP-like cAMP-binding protein